MHVHVHHADGEAKFWVEPQLQLAQNRGLSDQQIRAVQDILTEYEDEIRGCLGKALRGLKLRMSRSVASGFCSMPGRSAFLLMTFPGSVSPDRRFCSMSPFLTPVTRTGQNLTSTLLATRSSTRSATRSLAKSNSRKRSSPCRSN